jgi:ATP synthase protein I
MLRLVSLQMTATFVAGFIAGLLGGWSAMFSAVLGGLCCVVPNAVMAVRLFASAQKPGGANPATFFVWEFVKIALTLALLYVRARIYKGLKWFDILGGFILAIKCYIILIFWHKQ